MLIRDILARNARLFPDRPAVLAEDEEISHAELSQRTRRRAAALQAVGISRGDRIAVLTRPSPRYIELFFAAAQIGATLVPLNHLLVARELRAILSNCEPRLLLHAGEFRETSREIRDALPVGAKLLCLDDEAEGGEGEPARTSGTGILPVPSPPLDEGDVAMLVYIPGADGRSRGAMLSNGNLVFAAATGALSLELSRDDVCLSCHPFPFLTGAARILRFLYVGGAIVILREFDPEHVLRMLERRRVTHLLLTATMMARLLALSSPTRIGRTALKMVIYRGASIPLDLLKRAIRFFGCSMVQAYGQVESSGILTFLPSEIHVLDADASHKERLLSIGREAPGIEIRVVDEAGAEVSRGEVGEIVARGPNIFRGYHADPRATAEVMRDDWLRTGDVATMDAEGYVYVVDRSRDILTVGGHHVSPREIEEILLSHDAVHEAAVIGRPDYEWGEVPVAVVAPKKGAATDRDAILAHCRANLASFKVPQIIEFIPSLPRNSQGKVLKVKLKERSIPVPRRPPP